ncbi:hypothetical protein [Variovorax sp. YR216]|uniref:hypothetical protein n=1 Tax=Variovorax sp. YR216 TaxID=1882828 RepID=UPI00115F8FF0|nr:hypothetical protein [Variovorax sp. YR216]
MRLRTFRLAVWAAATLFLSAASALSVEDTPFTGNFGGSSGRVCSGGIHIRAKTLEWISTYRICKSSSYDVVERDASGQYPRIVFRIKNRSRQCGLEIFELAQADAHIGQWEATAYPSMEAYLKRDQPGWVDSQAPERQALSCMMFDMNR